MVRKFAILIFILAFALPIVAKGAGVPAFVVSGTVLNKNDIPVDGIYNIEVKNVSKEVTLKAITGRKIDEGKYTVTFIDIDGLNVAQAGDVLMVFVKGRGTNLIGITIHTLTAQDIRYGNVNIDVIMGSTRDTSVPSRNDVPVFTICGSVRDGEGFPVPNGFSIYITNETKGLEKNVPIDGTAGPGKYVATFVNIDGGNVASIGDRINVIVKAVSGRIAAECSYELTNADIASDLTVIDISLPPAPKITEFSPNRGGNNGMVTMSIRGYNLAPDYEVKLTQEGEADIIASPVTGMPGGHRLTARFDLIGKTPGLWNLTIETPSGISITRKNAFTIESGGSADLWVDVVGPDFVRPGRVTKFVIIVSNRGNIDAVCPVLWIDGIPSDVLWEIEAELINPTINPEDGEIDWENTPISIDMMGYHSIPLIMPPIGPNASVALHLKVTPTRVEGSFTLRVAISPPLIDLQGAIENLSPEAKECLEEILWSLIDLMIKEGLINNIPFSDCIIEGLKTGYDILSTIRNWYMATYNQDGPINYIVPYVSFQAQLVKATIVCAKQLAGEATGYEKIIDIIDFITKAIDVWNVFSSCLGVLQESFKDLVLLVPIDPNCKNGIEGYGNEHYCKEGIDIPYFIYFENLENAPVAAQEVLVTDQLDENLDWSTFSFSTMQIGEKTVAVPDGVQKFVTTVDLRPEKPIIIQVDCNFDSSAGRAEWLFRGKNPHNFEFADLLPPNKKDVAPRGEGWVMYTVESKPDLPTGTVIRNMATIDFEVDIPPDPIDTPEVFNTIDSGAPTSQVKPLPAEGLSTTFIVEWEGTDDENGSGIKDYTIYVSEDGSVFTKWISHTSEASAEFTGEHGHTYYFYSHARDNVGNVEAVSVEADTFTKVKVTSPRWDANKDGVVDILDLVLVGRYFSEQPPSNENADVNLDGKVDALDIDLVGKHFGDRYDNE